MIRDPSKAIDAARSPETSEGVLRELATSEHVFVLEAVAKHPRTSVASLAAMVPRALDDDPALRVCIALLKNPNTPELVLKEIGALAQAVSPVRYTARNGWEFTFLHELAQCERMTSETLGSLLDPGVTPTRVRDRISRRATNPTVLAVLSRDPSASISARPKRALEARKPKAAGRSETDVA